MKTKVFLYISVVFIMYSCKNNDSDKNLNTNKEKNIVLKKNIEEEYIKRDEKGNLLIKGNLLNNKKHGIWKCYNQGNLTDVIRYNQDTLMYTLDKNDYIYKDVFLEKINSYIPIPKYWELNQVFDDANTLLTAVKKCDDSIAYCQNITLRYEKITSDTFENFVKDYKNQIQNSIKSIIIKGFDKNKLYPKDSYILKYYINYNNTDLAFMTIWIKDNENAIIYTASCEKEELEKNLYLFLQIGNSITKKK
ncbi:hypothetical protein [Flavobacterium sp. NRK F7]|uniref:hypothetical protein n=1 Tax=Flavobacterium sp. NRK F7 TaxID=2954930 RepID=UPI0020902B0B|nr:hypothetical protein [Flavobacterium sp. NRK F7]MCO6164536.1 hypothetical protein [Flavobacterium sp. NRK F7]